MHCDTVVKGLYFKSVTHQKLIILTAYFEQKVASYYILHFFYLGWRIPGQNIYLENCICLTEAKYSLMYSIHVERPHNLYLKRGYFNLIFRKPEAK